MPVTIGTLTSRVNVVDGAAAPANDLVERVVQVVLARIKQQMDDEAQLREEREVRPRASDTDRY